MDWVPSTTEIHFLTILEASGLGRGVHKLGFFRPRLVDVDFSLHLRVASLRVVFPPSVSR